VAGAFVAVGAVATVVVAAMNGGGRSSEPTTGLPASMAAIGDSMTRAVNARGPVGADLAQHSWATGTDRGDGVVSHHERILAANGSAAPTTFNNAVSGARMSDAREQALAAVDQGVEYVTFLMGANDACAYSVGAMTPVRRFQRQLERTMRILAEGLPEARIYIVSIPDVTRLWDVLHGDPQAMLIWNTFGICRSALAQSNDAGARAKVRQRVIDYNRALAEACRRYPNCIWDGGAVFRYRFDAEDVSPIDFFHPSLTGQRHLADISWRHGPWADR
jgi:lysophospholipase L1-like esterase